MDSQSLRQHIKHCFNNAENNISKLPDEILYMQGMTGRMTRHFYNNLLNMPNVKYLEIGTWKGSSVCSAMYGNNADITCIDNWSEIFFGSENVKDDFLANINKYKGDNNVNYIEEDSFQVDISKLPKYNIYLYDGDHSYDAHYKALTHYYDCMDDTFIFIVDDWNWKQVRDGTENAIKDLNLSVLYEKDIRLETEKPSTESELCNQTWWNGIYVALLQKTR